jgi:hypothetical protein
MPEPHLTVHEHEVAEANTTSKLTMNMMPIMGNVYPLKYSDTKTQKS